MHEFDLRQDHTHKKRQAPIWNLRLDLLNPARFILPTFTGHNRSNFPSEGDSAILMTSGGDEPNHWRNVGNITMGFSTAAGKKLEVSEQSMIRARRSFAPATDEEGYDIFSLK